MPFWGYQEYVPVAQRREKNLKTIEKMRKNNPELAPVHINGKLIAESWWGKAWNANLAAYADYDNRISRGRSYVRNAAVLDLQIHGGEIMAVVQGSERKPYNVKITIQPLAADKCGRLLEQCGRSIQSMEELIAGRFPKAMGDLFTSQDIGLFPAPSEIGFRCDCYDWADMCKHVAAALYGVGARLDSAPLQLFGMRGVEWEALLQRSIDEKLQSMLQNAGKKSKRALDDVDISGLFGIS